jgi:hypothetical protein
MTVGTGNDRDGSEVRLLGSVVVRDGREARKSIVVVRLFPKRHSGEILTQIRHFHDGREERTKNTHPCH